MQNVVIGYIHNGDVKQKFMHSLMSLCNYDMHHKKWLEPDYQILSVSGLYLAEMRNKIAWAMLDIKKADWLLFIDTDIVFSADALDLLMEAADPITRQIVSGLYFTYMGDEGKLLPVWTYKDSEGQFRTVTNFNGDIQHIYGTGMGFCLIHRRALERIYEKYKDDCWPWFGHDLSGLPGIKGRLGEDNTFFLRASKVGIDVWGHCGVIVGHIKSREENFETFVSSINDKKKPESRIII